MRTLDDCVVFFLYIASSHHFLFFFFLNDTAPPEISPLPLHAALPICADIVVATPGRLLDHMERGHVDFSRLEVLVLDEADRMLDMGFAPDVRRILSALPEKRQTMLFSATVSPEVDALARRALDGHASVEIGRRAT